MNAAADPLSVSASVPLWIILALVLAVLTASLVAGIRFARNRKNEFARLGQVPPCPLLVSDILLLGLVLAVCVAFRQSQLMPLAAVAGSVILYQLRGTFAFAYWRFDVAELWSCCKAGWRGYLMVIVPLTVIALLVAGVCRIFGLKFTQPQVELFLSLKTPAQISLFLFFAVIVAPLWEEITFRGVLYPFLKKHLPMGAAMLLSSLLWAAIHLHWPVLLPFTFLGCALCFLYEQTGRLGHTIAVHAIFNLMTVLLLLFLRHYGDWQAY
jgi:membrane protease YdiL (CAAX protease family)